MATMLYQGHGSFRLTTGGPITGVPTSPASTEVPFDSAPITGNTTIYVDPFCGGGYDVPADIIIVTHEHADHWCTDKMPHAPGCEIFRAADFQPHPGDYRTIESHGVSMTPVQACNKNHPITECVGVVLEFDGLKFYAAGDTSTTDDMRTGKLATMHLDYATLPGDGFYNMGPAEASECARLIAAKHTIPVHLVPVHDMSNPTLFDQATAEKFEVEGLTILQPGEKLEL